MRLAAPAKTSPVRTEQIILFRVSGQVFAVSSASVQEVRSVDSLSGSATQIEAPGLRKVRQVVRRGERSLFIVNAAAHFNLPASSAQDSHGTLDRRHREDDEHDAAPGASALLLP
jgi:chemotaxis signal transduction protein